MKKIVAAMLVVFLASAETRAATTLLDYENRVFRAAEQVERIKTDADYAEEGMAYIRELLPNSETVLMNGQTIKVDNSWLHTLINQYQLEVDAQLRLAKLTQAGGRLRALDDHLREMELAQLTEAEQNNPRMKVQEILSRPEFKPKKQNKVVAFIKGIWDSISSFFSEMLRAIRRLLGQLFGSTAEGSWLSMALVILVLGLLAFLVARAIRKARPRRRRPKKRTILGEEIDAGTTAESLAERAYAAAMEGDFRNAIRRLYIALLYELSERRLIELEDSATNREYLARLSGKGALEKAMAYMTDRFDYFWYGMIPTSGEDFSAYLARYKEAVQSAQAFSQSPSRP
ncbi:MAG TPA: DUF4129 domain-containing protein [Blastocatellia bacterium]